MIERERERDNFVCTHARFASVGYEPRGSFIYLGHILIYEPRVVNYIMVRFFIGLGHTNPSHIFYM